jgi:hypothetical protein
LLANVFIDKTTTAKIFSKLVIANGRDTFYVANQNGFHNRKTKERDLDIGKPFYGYELAVKGKDYIKLSVFRQRGIYAGDDITIEWNNTSKQFQIQELP